MLVFHEYVRTNKNEFLYKVVEISKLLDINPDWLMVVMRAESNINPQAKNPGSTATGLIQFMASTARNLGTTVDALYKMSNVQQLDYVYKYLLPYKGKMKSVYDVYLAVFFPAALGKSDNWIIQSSSQSAYVVAKNNPAVDLNKNLVITVAEFKKYVDKFLIDKKVDLFGKGLRDLGVFLAAAISSGLFF